MYKSLDQSWYIKTSFVDQSGQKEKQPLQPRERSELSTPGLQDQCSNHWANEADTLVLKRAKTNKQTKKQTKTTVNRDTLSKKIKRIARSEY